MKEKKKIEKGCILFILHSNDLEGVYGPELFIYVGTSPLHIIILMNIYLYIFLDLFCSQESCLGWPSSDWTIWLSSGWF